MTIPKDPTVSASIDERGNVRGESLNCQPLDLKCSGLMSGR
jgi:hypothetical protein